MQRIILNKRHGGYGIGDNGLRYLAAQGMAEAVACLAAYEQALQNPTTSSGSYTAHHESTALYGYKDMHLSQVARNHPVLVAAFEAKGGDFMGGPGVRLELESLFPGEVIRDFDGKESTAFGLESNSGAKLMSGRELAAYEVELVLRPLVGQPLTTEHLQLLRARLLDEKR